MVLGHINCIKLLLAGLALVSAACPVAGAQTDADRQASLVSSAMDQAFNEGWERHFMQALPKGGDLHNHLQGAIYAETWLEWAAEDGLCVDMARTALVDTGGACEDGLLAAADVLADTDKRRVMINALSIRDFVPTPGFSGADQFFGTFFRMANKPGRFGDMLAAVADRAGRQNILYLELMHTIVLPELFSLVGGLDMTGDPAADYETLMASPFGAAQGDLVAKIRNEIAAGYARRDELLKCGTADASAGCGVKINLIHQVVREFEPAVVFAQIALGWAAMPEEEKLVGLNLVAPEHGYLALRDYRAHMAMIDYLYQSQGPRKVALHAGELALGQVRPKNLRFHIRSAIETGHALRIGHGTAIEYEDDSAGLLGLMRDRGIPVEINITSSDAILQITGDDHPVHLYLRYGVPIVLSTDDEGVARNDLTSEYERAVTDFRFNYFHLKWVSRNSLAYSFIVGDSLWLDLTCRSQLEAGGVPEGGCADLVRDSEKAALEWELEQRFRAFEQDLRAPPMRTAIMK